MDLDVLVIGAGISGLVAARVLKSAGLRVLVLEARDRVGGRIFSASAPGIPEAIELGAEFIHGKPSELMRLLDAAGLEVQAFQGESWCVTRGDWRRCELVVNLADLIGSVTRDQTAADFLATLPVDDRTRSQITDYVEGFNAADSQELSLMALAVQESPERESQIPFTGRLSSGYSALVKWIADSGAIDIRQNVDVRRIDWKPGQATARWNGGEMAAARVIITVPVSVLQAGDGLILSPEPPGYREALWALRMGSAVRVVFHFKEAFWKQNAEQLGFLHAEDEDLPTWWTGVPFDSFRLTGWAGGPRAARLLERGEQAVIEAAVGTLSRVFRRDDVQDLIDAYYFHNWQSDPYSRGAYSYVAAGGLDEAERLTEPVASTIYFAGEHTARGEWGTVHGAIASGLRAAGQILAPS
jgi:Monoamine oxidase